MDAIPSPPIIRLHPEDGVVIARQVLPPGTPVAPGLATARRLPAGHKVAVRSHTAGEAVRRYGQIIGFATEDIAAGAVGAHPQPRHGRFRARLCLGRRRQADRARCRSPPPSRASAAPTGASATRNYIGIITSVNCSAHVADLIATAFRRNPLTGEDPLAEWPNVDGVVALTHKTGCGMTAGEPLTLLRRTLGGFARHANFSHVIAIGLGCEVNQIGGLLEEQRLSGRLRTMDIQEMGGTRKTVEAGHRLRPGGAGRGEPRGARAGAGERALTSRCNAAAPTAIPASPPTRRWARRATWWCVTAAR